VRQALTNLCASAENLAGNWGIGVDSDPMANMAVDGGMSDLKVIQKIYCQFVISYSKMGYNVAYIKYQKL